MPGRAGMTSVSAVKSDIASARKGENNSGVSGSDQSAIGGAGRQGTTVSDSLTFTRIDQQGSGGNGMASGGQQGVGYGSGRTFPGKKP